MNLNTEICRDDARVRRYRRSRAMKRVHPTRRKLNVTEDIQVQVKGRLGAPSVAAAMTKLEADSTDHTRRAAENPKNYYSAEQQAEVRNRIAWHQDQIRVLDVLVRHL